MKEKMKNPYLGLPEEKRWKIYKKGASSFNIGFFLHKDLSIPKGAHILMIDPSRVITGIARKLFLLFLDETAQIERVHNQSEAIAKLKENPNYALIISSNRIFHGSLYSLLKELKDMHYTGHFLLHASIGEKEAYSIVQETGIDGFILKPHGMGNFVEAMQKVKN